MATLTFAGRDRYTTLRGTTSKPLSALLQTRFLSALGKYTFALYLTHLLVIYTVSTSVVILTHKQLGYNGSVLLAFTVSIPMLWIVSFLFERYIDAPSIKFAKYVGALYRGDASVDPASRLGRVSTAFKRTFRRETPQVKPTPAPADSA